MIFPYICGSVSLEFRRGRSKLAEKEIRNRFVFPVRGASPILQNTG